MLDAFADKAELAHTVAAVRAVENRASAVRFVEEVDMHIQLEAVAAVATIRWAFQPRWGTLEVLV